MLETYPEEEINDAARSLVEEIAEATPDTPWWEDNYKLKELRAKLDLKLSEIYKVASLGKETDIVNYTEGLLSEDELQQINYAVSAVSSFTGGKIFDRFNGIALVPREAMARKDYGKDLNPEEELVAAVDTYTGLMLFNIDSMRDPIKLPFKRRNPLINYFARGHKPTALEFFIAHELGHFMDLSYVSEIDRHGFDKTKANPRWDGWATIDGEDSMTKSFDAFDHPNPAIHTLERSLTPRASLNASEDFAETFAIAALRGDVSSAPNKQKKLLETIQLAKGDTVIGPHKAQITKIFTRL